MTNNKQNGTVKFHLLVAFEGLVRHFKVLFCVDCLMNTYFTRTFLAGAKLGKKKDQLYTMLMNRYSGS